MRLAIIAGTRPELIRLSKIIPKCQKYFDTTLIWTSQNFDKNLSTQFFKEFGIEPDIEYVNDNKLTGIAFIGNCIRFLNASFQYDKDGNEIDKPEAVLVLGDTNSSFATVTVAKRLGIPVFHLEAGNRCYDEDRVPEEVNRRQIDAIADWHLCYTQRAREQLFLERSNPERTIVVGNPIAEVMETRLIKDHNKREYYLATLHRKENIDNKHRRHDILMTLQLLDKPVKLSAHPSLMSKLSDIEIKNLFTNIEFFTPSNFKDFLSLEYNADCVITDSGTIPEECYILNTPCILLRYSTERPELLESNAMIVCNNTKELKTAILIAKDTKRKDFIDIKEYHNYTSDNVIKILMRYKE